MLANKLLSTDYPKPISYINSKSAAPGNVSAISLTYPPNALVGDFALMVILDSSGTAVTCPGWTRIFATGGVQLFVTTISSLTAQSFSTSGSALSGSAYVHYVLRNAVYRTYNVKTAYGAVNPDPPAVSGSHRAWLSVLTTNSTTSSTYSSPPTNFTNNKVQIGSAGGISVASYILSQGSISNYDPSAYTAGTTLISSAFTIGLT